MSQVTNCNCNCARPGAFNFQPTARPAVDCFFMQKVNQVFSGDFSGLNSTFILDSILSPTNVTPVPPYTFISAVSGNDMSVVTSIVQLPDIVSLGTNSYQFDIAVPTDLVFVDSTGQQFFATGTVNIRIEVTTPLTYDEINESGMAIAVTCFEAMTGVYVNSTTFSLVICGSVDIVFICPALMRVRHEGECTFMAPIGEHVCAVSDDEIPPRPAAGPIRIR